MLSHMVVLTRMVRFQDDDGRERQHRQNSGRIDCRSKEEASSIADAINTVTQRQRVHRQGSVFAEPIEAEPGVRLMLRKGSIILTASELEDLLEQVTQPIATAD